MNYLVIAVNLTYNMLNLNLDKHQYVVLFLIHQYRGTSNLGEMPIIFQRFFLKGFVKPLFFEFNADPLQVWLSLSLIGTITLRFLA